jgi:predicted metal-dependent hydrolase
MNHGPAFYRLFDRVCPGHRELRRWLIEHEGELHL